MNTLNRIVAAGLALLMVVNTASQVRGQSSEVRSTSSLRSDLCLLTSPFTSQALSLTEPLSQSNILEQDARLRETVLAEIRTSLAPDRTQDLPGHYINRIYAWDQDESRIIPYQLIWGDQLTDAERHELMPLLKTQLANFPKFGEYVLEEIIRHPDSINDLICVFDQHWTLSAIAGLTRRNRQLIGREVLPRLQRKGLGSELLAAQFVCLLRDNPSLDISLRNPSDPTYQNFRRLGLPERYIQVAIKDRGLNLIIPADIARSIVARRLTEIHEKVLLTGPWGLDDSAAGEGKTSFLLRVKQQLVLQKTLIAGKEIPGIDSVLPGTVTMSALQQALFDLSLNGLDVLDDEQRIDQPVDQPVNIVAEGLNAFVEGPAQRLFHEILNAEGKPFSSNAYGPLWKGVFWERDGQRYFTPLALSDYESKEARSATEELKTSA